MKIAQQQQGVGLIEVLIAIVLISIGFLAVAKMQVEGMRYSQSAYFNAQATMMIKDITDRMRSNREGVQAGLYNAVETNTNTTVPTCVASAIACTPIELAQKDIAEWSANLHAPQGAVNFVPLLPSGDSVNAVGKVTVNGSVYDIAVQWAEKIDGNFETKTLTAQFVP